MLNLLIHQQVVVFMQNQRFCFIYLPIYGRVFQMEFDLFRIAVDYLALVHLFKLCRDPQLMHIKCLVLDKWMGWLCNYSDLGQLCREFSGFYLLAWLGHSNSKIFAAHSLQHLFVLIPWLSVGGTWKYLRQCEILFDFFFNLNSQDSIFTDVIS